MDVDLKINKEIVKAIKVGVPIESMDRNGVSNEKKAFWLEFGTVKSTPRPFMRNAVEKIKEDINFFEGLDPDAWGMKIVKAIKNEMLSGNFASLSPSTIKSRARRGNPSTQPTVDTAELLNSIDFEVIG